jgi:hypothetical protein
MNISLTPVHLTAEEFKVVATAALPFVFMGEKSVSNEVVARFEKGTFAGQRDRFIGLAGESGRLGSP